jgi:hypothetical protein
LKYIELYQLTSIGSIYKIGVPTLIGNILYSAKNTAVLCLLLVFFLSVEKRKIKQKTMSKPNSPAVTRANLLKNNNKELTLQDVIRELHAMRDENKKNVAEMIDSQTEKFNAVNNQITKIQEDQSNLLVQHQNLKGNLENLTTSHFSLSNDFVASKNQVNKLTSTVQGLTVQLNELKQTQLSQNIIFNGIPANIILDKSHICQLAQQLVAGLFRRGVISSRVISSQVISSRAISSRVISSRVISSRVISSRVISSRTVKTCESHC